MSKINKSIIAYSRARVLQDKWYLSIRKPSCLDSPFPPKQTDQYIWITHYALGNDTDTLLGRQVHWMDRRGARICLSVPPWLNVCSPGLDFTSHALLLSGRKRTAIKHGTCLLPFYRARWVLAGEFSLSVFTKMWCSQKLHENLLAEAKTWKMNK